MCQPIRDQGGHVGFSIRLKSSNTMATLHKEHLWQVWSRPLLPFLRRSSKYVSQSEDKVAVLDFRSA